ncbi:MAG: tRNA (uridine(34)/cytosine(34)/5-carboxymethylaminomethyluridine(34)-2'-O)-methyltransferase TrmL [Clostridia bacterium]|nr:tRNA (uridine(34)/cytosine(34)/5-carboxymethylaminomethyluridine(34)-2'-O)-methyltransferase TrmL [Clostridia bacterium]MDD4387370.1 tRNA (uridine(34)/cytosine(34)/5-carboxymethylaminomethyluridine(34)-2'-O)-methyltransferase TrmL [Clostridia bacterium]
MLNIVLIEPEIPQNTGNISRTCAVINARLHLIKPLGFDISDKAVKRSGLDYWNKLNVIIYENLEEFKEKTSGKNIYLISTKAKNVYTNVIYKDDDYLIFGPETRGIPESYILDNFNNSVRIPMGHNLRSLNLSNSVAIVVYEALRQLNFLNLEQTSTYFDK